MTIPERRFLFAQQPSCRSCRRGPSNKELPYWLDFATAYRGSELPWPRAAKPRAGVGQPFTLSAGRDRRPCGVKILREVAFRRNRRLFSGTSIRADQPPYSRMPLGVSCFCATTMAFAKSDHSVDPMCIVKKWSTFKCSRATASINSVTFYG
jgi:hypothetical protein